MKITSSAYAVFINGKTTSETREPSIKRLRNNFGDFIRGLVHHADKASKIVFVGLEKPSYFVTVI
jgi:hypothetical protein